MIKYALACCLMLGLGLTAEAQVHHQHHPHHRPVAVQHRLHHTHRHYNYHFAHRPNVVLYGQFHQYQQFGFAVVGYSDLVAVQNICTHHGLQIVRVNAAQRFVVVRVPHNFGWNNIVRFSRSTHIRFVEPGFRHYRVR